MFSRKIKYAAVAAVLSVTLCTGCSLFHKEDSGQKEIDSEFKEDDEIIAAGGGNGSTGEGAAVQETTEDPAPASEPAPQTERDESETELESRSFPAITKLPTALSFLILCPSKASM